jgi:hypothetical protein
LQQKEEENNHLERVIRDVVSELKPTGFSGSSTVSIGNPLIEAYRIGSLYTFSFCGALEAVFGPPMRSFWVLIEEAAMPALNTCSSFHQRWARTKISRL